MLLEMRQSKINSHLQVVTTVHNLLPAHNSLSIKDVLASWGCHYLITTNWWLKTTETYLLSVLGARSLKPRCGQGHARSKGLREEPFLFQLLEWLHAFFGLWSHHSSPAFRWPSLCVFSLALLRTLVTPLKTCFN